MSHRVLCPALLGLCREVSLHDVLTQRLERRKARNVNVGERSDVRVAARRSHGLLDRGPVQVDAFATDMVLDNKNRMRVEKARRGRNLRLNSRKVHCRNHRTKGATIDAVLENARPNGVAIEVVAVHESSPH